MTAAIKIIKYELSDIFRSKWVVLYAAFFFLITDALFRFGGSSARVMLSLMNLVLVIIPLMSVVFGVMYLYNNREFIELMLSQPIDRRSLFSGLFAGLAVPLSLGFVAGVGIPFLVHGFEDTAHWEVLGLLLAAGVFLTAIFIALAFLISIVHEDKVMGLGVAIFNWLLFSVIFDGMVLLIITLFGDYPLEKAMIALTMLNPIDLARVLVLLKFDVAALMGYTGAVFQEFFGRTVGVGISLLALHLWVIMLFWLGKRRFRRKDF